MIENNFGKGKPDGIAASEASNNAVTGRVLVSIMALGIPGAAISEVMLATLTLHGNPITWRRGAITFIL